MTLATPNSWVFDAKIKRKWGRRRLLTRSAVPGLLMFCLALVRADAANETNFAAQAQQAFFNALKKYEAEPRNSEAAWQFGRACYDRADFATNNTERGEIAQLGIAACEQLIARERRSAQAHYYLALNLGQLAQTRGLGALKLVDRMEREFTIVRELDERLDYAGADRGLGLLYRDAPAVASIGSRGKARRHLQRANEVAPGYPENQLNLIESYLKWSDRNGARRELKALEESWANAQKQFNGQSWASSWIDWDERLQRAKKKVEETPKAIETPRSKD